MPIRVPRKYRNLFISVGFFFVVVYLLIPRHSSPAVSAPTNPPWHIKSAPKKDENDILWRTDDAQWQSAFSSDITHDETTVLLPPLPPRPPVYAYYEPKERNVDTDVWKQEQHLLLQWRRAWWAQGFRPTILGRNDAMKHPLFSEKKDMPELYHMLAWSQAAASQSAILTDVRVFPMAPRDHPTLSFLRKGNYSNLKTYSDVKPVFYFGSTSTISEAIQQAIHDKVPLTTTSILDNIAEDGTSQSAFAAYEHSTLPTLYPSLFSKDKPDRTTFQMLSDLIDSHLRNTWQSAYSEIAVIKPLPKHTTVLTNPALLLAQNLTSCPPLRPEILTSCPHNRPSCKPCLAATPLPINTPGAFRNISARRIFHIGIMAHPLTIASLIRASSLVSSLSNRRHLPIFLPDPQWIRSSDQAGRDAFLTAFTQDSRVRTPTGQLRVLKAAVASNWAVQDRQHAYWFNAEDAWGASLDVQSAAYSWRFGFELPQPGRDARTSAESITPVPGPERRPKPLEEEGRPVDADENELRVQEMVSEKMAHALQRKKKKKTNFSANDYEIESNSEDWMEMERRRRAAEGWSMAEAEAWRFVRAWIERERVVREVWMAET